MMKRAHPIRHIVIWLVIAVVLFPVLWIFTTSIRRGNAYISTSLFSGQTTWQNYVDLILEPKNVPALYNEVSNIYSLGEPYNKMSKKKIIAKLNSDFNAYDRYFKSTLRMSNSIKEDAKWINTNFLPEAKKAAVKNVKKYGTQDVIYLNELSSYLSKKYSALGEKYKLAGLLQTLKKIENSPTPQMLSVIKNYFPNVSKQWEKYSSASKASASKISNFPSEISELLSNNKISGKNANDLIAAYKQTYKMLVNGNFSYSKWFAPIYLREINMNTIKISQSLHGADKIKLIKMKNDLFSTVQNLNAYKISYTKSVQNALNTSKNAYEELVGNLQDSLNNLENSYSKDLNDLSVLQNNASVYSATLTKDASQIALFANNIIPTSIALENFVSILKTVLKGESQNSNGKNEQFYDFSPYIILTKKWLSLASDQQSFLGVTKKVNVILNNLEFLQSMENFMATHLTLDAISNIKSSLPFVTLKLKSGLEMSMPVLKNYDSTKKELNAVYFKTKQITKEISKISKEILPLRKKLETLNSSIILAQLYYLTKISKDSLKSQFDEINSFENARLFLENLSNFYSNLENSNVKLPAFPSYSRYDEFFNVEKLIKTVSLALKTSNDIDRLVTQYASYIDKLKNRSTSYIEINKLGFPLIVKELSTLNSLYQQQYVSKIGPNLGIISRRTHDLSSLKYFSEVSTKLSSMNSKAYYITQEWKVKYIPPFMRWLLNSIIVAGSAAVVTVFLSALMAYPFSRFRFVGRKYGLIGILLVQMFPTMMAMVALYLLLNFIGKFFPPLGLNTLGGLAFLYIGGGIAFDAWLTKGFFDAIPKELEEAAMVDGATRFQTFWKIILPLSAPILAVTTILGFVGNYGDYILASIVLTGINHYTYAVGLQTFSTSQYSTNWGLMTAAALIGMIPILVLFLGLQRFIVSGLTQGSVKG